MATPPDMLADKALSAVRLPARPAKPRRTGLTICADRGLGTRAQADLLEQAAPYIDIVKFASGLPRLLDPALVRRKVDLYAAEQIGAFFAGELSELAVMQGRAADYYAQISDLGGWGVEISNAQIAMGIAQKAKLVEIAGRAGLAVVAECGRKGGEDWSGAKALAIAEARACFDAGAAFVLIQAEGINEGVERINAGFLQDIAAALGTERLIFQGKESDAMSWFLTAFGDEVNLDVEPEQVLDLEARRRGIRKRGIFGLMAGHQPEA